MNRGGGGDLYKDFISSVVVLIFCSDSMVHQFHNTFVSVTCV